MISVGENPQSKQEKEIVNGAARASPWAAPAALPCLSHVNCRNRIESGQEGRGVPEESDGKQQPLEKVSSAQNKSVWGLRQNLKYWIDALGMENMAFFTMTFKENVVCKREAERRYKRFRNHFEEIGIKTVVVKVGEPQQRGAWHYHCMVDMGQDVRTGFDFVAYKHTKQIGQAIWQHGGFSKGHKKVLAMHGKRTKDMTSSAAPRLRSAWHKIRKAASKSGFGRCELIPVQHTKAVADYVGKYLAKGFTCPNMPGTYRMRKISYCRGLFRRVSPRFSWAFGPGAEWRKNLGAWAWYNGIVSGDFAVIKRRYGPKWAYLYGEGITYVGKRERMLSRLKKHTMEQLENLRDSYDRRHYEDWWRTLKSREAIEVVDWGLTLEV